MIESRPYIVDYDLYYNNYFNAIDNINKYLLVSYLRVIMTKMKLSKMSNEGL